MRFVRRFGLPVILILCLCGSMGLWTFPLPAQPAVSPPTPRPSLRTDRIQAVGDRLRDGTLTPDKVLQDDGLTPHELLKMLEQRWFPAKDRIILAGLLVKHGAHLLVPAETMGPRAKLALEPRLKLALAEYFRSVLDVRAVPLLEERLAAIKQPDPKSLVPELNLLASYYVETGQFQKALELYLQAPRYSTNPEYLASHLMHAARIYRQLGNEAKAQELQAQVAQHGFAWVTGMMRWEQAAAFMEKGRHDEARRLLQEPLTGRYADQVRVGLLSLLAKSYYRMAEFDSARKYGTMAQEQYRSIPNPMQGEGLERQLETAREIVLWSEQWSQSPLVCEPAQMRIAWPAAKTEKPIMQRLAIRAFRAIPVELSLEVAPLDTRIKARLEDGWRQHEYFVEKRVTIEIAPQAMEGAVAGKWQATLVLKSAAFADRQVRVPIRMEAPQPIAP